LHVFLI